MRFNLSDMKLDDLVDDLCRFLISRATSPPFIFGISGGQGAGKTTLCAALARALANEGKTALTLSLDDFYLSKAARQHLAQTVHPLCATRGVPGTHDVALLTQVLNGLAHVSPDAPLHLPRFSKSHDDTLLHVPDGPDVPDAPDVQVSACPDIVFLEGWCVGGRASCVEPRPQNSWEETHDPQSVWKQWSQASARAYQPIWDMAHATLLLRQKNFEAVVDSRWLQEQGNARESGVWQFADRSEVAAFCAHYESWTLGIWDDLGARADFVFGRNADYEYFPLKAMNNS